MMRMKEAAPLASEPRIYHSVNQPVLQSIPPGVGSVLDIGCGTGAFGAAIKSVRSCRVVGVTYSEAESTLARAQLDHVEFADLNLMDPASLGRFDCIVCSHVLEHLSDPKRQLQALRVCLGPSGILIVALPNVLHWKQRLQFMLGRFRYTEGGRMDSTHFRFFDWNTSAELLRDAGYQVDARAADGILLWSRLLGAPLSGRLDQAAVSLMPGLFGTQFIFRCHLKDTAVDALRAR
jgi:SAM-dependent methyltransferase